MVVFITSTSTYPVSLTCVYFPYLSSGFFELAFIFRVKKEMDMPMLGRLSLGSFRRPVIQERNVHPFPRIH